MPNLSKSFIGRDLEVSRLNAFLKLQNGGMLLIGGDRGSGKTEIVKQVIEDLNKHSKRSAKIRSWTMSPTININIPLMILATNATNGDELQDAYRARLLRSMLAGLVIDLKNRYNFRYPLLDLPLRWFRPIGYIQRIYSISHYSTYISAATSKSSSFSFGFKGTNSVLQAALQAEMDISDSKLEMELSNVLRQYSNAQKIIFVFDELDKLPDTVSLDELVLFLKNLFSGTGVYGIFITDSDSFKKIMKKASKIPPTQQATLFQDQLLINNMNIEDFEKLVVNTTSINDDTDKSELLAALSYQTNRSPHMLQKYILKNGETATELITALKNDIGSYKFSRISALSNVTDQVYEMYSSESRDDSFKRILHDSLKKTSEILSDNKTEYIDQTEPDTVFFTSDVFLSDEITNTEAKEHDLQYKIDRKFFNEIAEPVSYTILNDLSDDERNLIRSAIATLITYLERNNFISLANTKHKDVYEIGSISQDLTLSKYNDIDWEMSFQLTDIEKKTFDMIRRYNPAILRLTSKNLASNRYMITSHHKNNKRYGKYSLYSMKVNWTALKSISDSAESTILKSIFNLVQSSAGIELSSSTVARNMISISTGNQTVCRIVILYGRQPQPSVDQTIKTFIFRDESSSITYNRKDLMIKNFRVNKAWSNTNSMIKEVANYITTHNA